MRYYILASLFSIAFAVDQASWDIGEKIKTTSGNVVGQASSWKAQVSEYLGVPFAQPPTGDLRWAAPQAIKNSTKTINATKYVSA